MGVTQNDNIELYYPKAGNNSDDFIGFSFNGVTSKTLGISRVSDGSRYDEQMLPNFQDKSAQMPGSDYTLYWESFYNTKTWNIQIAFDHMNDSQMQLFRQTFHTKNMGELKFAEREGIHWLAKVQAPPQLKYICFDEDGERIYKGEGTIQFISYYPFGMSDIHTEANISNKLITNNGDIPMEWFVVLSRARAQQLSLLKVEVGETATGILRFNTMDVKSTDSYVVINSKTNLIEGASSYNATTGKYTPTGNVYNKFVRSGDFFKIPVGESTFFITGPTNTVRNLHYNFLYL